MSTIYFDTHLGDEERRRRLYAGDVFVCSPRPSTRALTEFARELIEEAFHPLDPQHAQDSLPVEKFVEIVGPLKPRFIHHPRTLELLLALLRDLGADMDKTYFDVPRMRVATSGGYLTAGVAYVLHPHRDIWYSSPPCQLNWWLPVYPFESESSFSFHQKYWKRARAQQLQRVQPLRVEQDRPGQRLQGGQDGHPQAAQAARNRWSWSPSSASSARRVA